MFKIEVFNALQMRFGPSKYTSLKTTLQETQPQTEIEDVTQSPQYNLPTTRTNKRTRALSLQEVEFRWSILNSSHCTGNMYYITHAQVQCKFCISILCS